MKEFTRLAVWEKAHRLTLAVYNAAASFPREEMYGLRSQMRRCAASIPANIAEGCGRTGNGEFHRFLNISAGSAFELEYFVLLSHDLKFILPQAHESLLHDTHEVQQMLAFITKGGNQSGNSLIANGPT